MKTLKQQLSDAIILASLKHEGQFDKCGQPYILHPLNVMFKVKDYGLHHMIVAVLHDIVEDTDVTLEDLRKLEHDDIVIDAIDALSRIKNEDYWDYINRVRLNYISRVVKLADLEHNMDLRRLLNINKDIDMRTLLNKYTKAYDILLRPYNTEEGGGALC